MKDELLSKFQVDIISNCSEIFIPWQYHLWNYFHYDNTSCEFSEDIRNHIHLYQKHFNFVSPSKNSAIYHNVHNIYILVK